MKVQNGACSDVRVAYIGGGSHGWAWTFFKDLAREEDIEKNREEKKNNSNKEKEITAVVELFKNIGFAPRQKCYINEIFPIRVRGEKRPPDTGAPFGG